MIKKNKWKLIVSSIVILLPVVAGLIMWNSLPEEMAVHWNLSGVANGWRGRFFPVFVLPLILLAGHWIGILVMALDPQNRNQTRKAMGLIFWVCPVVSLFASAMIYANAFGMDLGGGAFSAAALGVLFIVIGNFLPTCRRNHTMGIKVKWTLESDANWNATHRFGGKVWVIGGLLLMLCGFLPRAAVHCAAFAGIILLAVIPCIYSYVYYRKQKRDGTVSADASPSLYKRIRTIVVCVVLLGCGILLFTGNIQMQYDDASFTIAATYWSDLTVSYADIRQIEYREQNTAGSRTSGFGSLRLQMGSYQNEEFGYYTRYTYTMCKSCVVLDVNGRTLVINGVDADHTKMICDELMARIS